MNLSARESAKLAIDAMVVFWKQARIPVREEHKCVDKLMKLYEKWKVIQKTTASKRSDAQKKAAASFVENLDDLFDIATADAVQTMKIEEDKEFLKMQRLKGRPGCMIGVDMSLFGKEKRADERRAKEQERKRKHEEELARQTGNSSFFFTCFQYKITCSCNSTAHVNVMEWSELIDSDENDMNEPDFDANETFDYGTDLESMPFLGNDSFETNDRSTGSVAKRGRKQFITARLAAALDNAKVSDGMAVHILIAAIEALGHRVEEYAINRSTLHRIRQENRLRGFEGVSSDFSDNVI